MLTVKPNWTFKPVVSIESLPVQDRARALTLYGFMTRETEQDIVRETERRWKSYAAGFGLVMSVDLVTSLKEAWLVPTYLDIVSSVVSSGPNPPAASDVSASSDMHTFGPATAAAVSRGCTSLDATPSRKQSGVEITTCLPAFPFTDGLI